jgi:hypothetical protein
MARHPVKLGRRNGGGRPVDERDPARPAASSSTDRLVWIAILAAIVFGIGVRIWMYSSPLGALDSDEALWGLVTKYALRGEFYALYPGQPYGGTVEVYLSVPFVALMGMTRLAIRIVPLGLHILGCVLVWRVARRTTEEIVARVAGAIFWIWPPTFVWFSIKERGFYGVTLVCALVVILEALRLKDEVRPLDAAALGLALGIGWWASPQIAFTSAPLLVWLLVRKPSVTKQWSIVAATTILGASPWIWNLINEGFDRLTPKLLAVDDGFFTHLSGFFREALPAALGLRVVGSGDWVLGAALGVALYLAFVIGLIWAIRRHPGLEPFGWITVAYPLLFSMNPASWLVNEPRYLYLLAPVLAIVLATLLVRLRIVHLGIALLIALTVIGSVRMSRLYFWELAEGQVPSDFGPLVSLLEDNDLDRVVADYWVAYRIDFESEERIIATPFHGARYQRYVDQVRQAERPAYVFIEGSSEATAFLDDMGTKGIELELLRAPGFVIYVPRSPAPFGV